MSVPTSRPAGPGRDAVLTPETAPERPSSAGSRPSRLDRLDTIVAGAVLVLSFLPYVAVNIGANSNIPLSTLACFYVIARRANRPVVLWSTIAFVLLPFAATYLRMFVAPHPIMIGPYIVWVASAVVTPGMIAAMLILGRRALPITSLTIIFSSVMALVQSYFLNRGVMPWLWYYQAKGYRSVEEWSEEILMYHPRPFGLFPEPSFMAGTLSLACLFMVIMCIWWDIRYSWREWTAMAVTIPALMLSVSGSLALTLAVLVASFSVPLIRRSPLFVSLAPVILGAGVYGSLYILQGRTSGGFNSSWVDRPSSIIIAFQPFLHDPAAFFLGIGNGMVNVYFLTAKFPLYVADHYNTLPDMFSVTGRILVENGALLAGPVLGWMAWGFVAAPGLVRRLVGLGALASWFVVASLTITYYSAFWLWGLPGGMIAMWLLTRDHSPAERPSRTRSTD